MITTYAGIATIVGKPNVGKSTLLNALLGSQIAPVSSKPQTTRRPLRGIYTDGPRQVVFVDTPGLHEPADQLDNYMQRQIREALEEVDLVLWVTDLRHPPTSEDALVARQLGPLVGKTPIWLLGNKLDTATRPDEAMPAYHALLPAVAPVLKLSAFDLLATCGLRQDLLKSMPEGPMLYPPEFGESDQSPLQWAGEMIRQAAIERLHQEIPYTVAVKVQTLEEREKLRPKPSRLMYCKAIIYLEREAHKPIVIGHHGAKLKSIGLRSRKLLESVLGQKVYLDLEVQVYPNWRKDKEALRQLDFE